jgi:hypothetical protein
MTLTRGELIRGALALAILGWPRIVRAGAPTPLQAQLLGRLAAFDRSFAARAGAVAKVWFLHKPKDAESASVTNAVAKAAAALPEIGGLHPEITVAELGDPTALATRCPAEHLAIVYFGPSTEGDMPAVARALAGVDLITVGGSGLHAEKGAVVGFDVEEGRPRIVVNLRSAKAQKVSFRAELLKLARVIE